MITEVLGELLAAGLSPEDALSVAATTTEIIEMAEQQAVTFLNLGMAEGRPNMALLETLATGGGGSGGGSSGPATGPTGRSDERQPDDEGQGRSLAAQSGTPLGESNAQRPLPFCD